MAELIARIVGYDGKFVFGPSKPNGTPRKVMDVSRLAALGWRARTPLEQRFRAAYQAYLATL